MKLFDFAALCRGLFLKSKDEEHIFSTAECPCEVLFSVDASGKITRQPVGECVCVCVCEGGEGRMWEELLNFVICTLGVRSESIIPHPLTSHPSPLTTYHLPLTPHHLPLTPHPLTPHPHPLPLTPSPLPLPLPLHLGRLVIKNKALGGGRATTRLRFKTVHKSTSRGRADQDRILEEQVQLVNYLIN